MNPSLLPDSLTLGNIPTSLIRNIPSKTVVDMLNNSQQCDMDMCLKDIMTV